MSFQPQTFDQAKADFKPMARKPMKRRSSAIPYGTNSLGGRKKKAKAKKISDGKLKKKVWKEFSIFIRTRGANAEGINECFTCDARQHWKTLEAGHLVPGRNNAVLFSEVGVNPQCRRCNGHFRGNTIVYYPKMVRLHGQAVVDGLIAARDETRKWAPGELQTLLSHYKALNAANPLTQKELKASL